METQYIAPQIKIKEFRICQSLLGGMSMKVYNMPDDFEFDDLFISSGDEIEAKHFNVWETDEDEDIL